MNPLDTSFAKALGGRWNPSGAFGALYLCATVAVAAANARHQFAGRAIKLFDLQPVARPQLVAVNVPRQAFVDAITAEGVEALELPQEFPFGVPWPPCQAIARNAYDDGLPGVAARSNAEATATSWIGEELAAFDTMSALNEESREPFEEWYPDAIPERIRHLKSKHR